MHSYGHGQGHGGLTATGKGTAGHGYAHGQVVGTARAARRGGPRRGGPWRAAGARRARGRGHRRGGPPGQGTRGAARRGGPRQGAARAPGRAGRIGAQAPPGRGARGLLGARCAHRQASARVPPGCDAAGHWRVAGTERRRGRRAAAAPAGEQRGGVRGRAEACVGGRVCEGLGGRGSRGNG
ncbi:hypothetical protein PVAP13_8KG352115 [Panicum virgatum]|uniref:Uncharacterized protein n=1 Tax=Panicum virgatum TaxID=38727 RepID=A0A8T0PUP0_PANVG|nr:hypothetical protein PVAP13_8KG352115 [Panicum virgatum]